MNWDGPQGRPSAVLVVLRVKRLGETATRGQSELFDTWRHHAFITNTTLDMVDADAVHRGHVIIEQVIFKLKAWPLAHLPSGKHAANAPWYVCAVIAFNIISRAAAVATGTPKASVATLLRHVIAVPARLATTRRRLAMHLPTRWPWRSAWANLWDTATGPPAPART